VSDPNTPFGHEPELSHLIDLLVPDDGVFLDVGSNVGYFSIFLAARPNFRGRIHAFEPIASSYAGLRDMVDSLQCDRIVTCHQAAASDKNGMASMELGTDPGLASIKEGTLQRAEAVRIITLDSLKFDRVDFVKIDVEGHEASALKGAEALIRSSAPYIFLESWTFDEQPDKVFEALQFLLDRGYRLYLPAWLQPNGSFLVGIGAGFEMETLGLVPFLLKDRLTFPGNPINIFACPASRESRLGETWSAKRIRGRFENQTTM
jgi:FkbM family methyltransferase